MDITQQSSVRLKVGDRVSYRYKRQVSVGFDAQYKISDPMRLQLLENSIEYATPERLQEGMTGADRALGRFVFQATRAGTVVLTIQHCFRGRVESEAEIAISIEDALDTKTKEPISAPISAPTPRLLFRRGL